LERLVLLLVLTTFPYVHDPTTRITQPQDLEASVGPFLLSTEYAEDDFEVAELCVRLSSALSVALGHGERLGREGGRKGRWKVKETKFVTSAGEKIIL